VDNWYDEFGTDVCNVVVAFATVHLYRNHLYEPDDIAQEVFLGLSRMHNNGALPADADHVRHIALGMVTKRVVDFLRKYGKELGYTQEEIDDAAAGLDDGGTEESGDDDLDEEAKAKGMAAAWQAAATIPFGEPILKLRLLGRSYRDIADTVGVGRDTVQRRLQAIVTGARVALEVQVG
jgi:DNA-directed RNA polymerase specialized sigma24 family protein